MNEWMRTRCESGNCVEVNASGPDVIMIRSNLAPEKTLAITRGEWEAFVAGVKAGDFDDV